MDKELQRKILKVINDNGGVAPWNKIITNIQYDLLKTGDFSKEDTKVTINHQLQLLEKEDKVIRRDQLPSIDYILTPSGHREVGPIYLRVWYFILHDRHNLFALLALIISFISLVLSWLSVRTPKI
jgi:hypothetical protein